MPPAAIATRLVAAWVLVGAVVKLPADLPQLVRDLPLGASLAFKLAVGAELVVGAFALLRPSRGWFALLLLLLAFLAVLTVQVAQGAPSCGCFGAALVIAPGVMLALDGALALLLLGSRPWRRAPGRSELGLPLAAVISLCLVALPILIDREAKPGEQGGTGGLRRYANLELDTMTGKKLAATRLYAWLDEEQRVDDGVIVIWRASCEVCAEHLDNLARREEGEREVVLLELPKEYEDEKVAVERLPLGAFVHESRLPASVIWDLTPPVHIEVVAGTVTKVLEGMECVR